MHPLDLAIIVAYLVVITIVGFRVSRRVHDATGFFLAGRSLTFWVVGLSIIGTNVSANGYVGAAGGAYKVGIAQANFEWIGAIPAMILQRTLGARSQWDASASMMFAAFAKTLVPLLIVFPGLLALVMHAQIEYPDMALPWIVKNVLPPGLSGLMFIAIIAGLQSSIDSSVNSTALMVTRDIRGAARRQPAHVQRREHAVRGVPVVLLFDGRAVAVRLLDDQTGRQNPAEAGIWPSRQ